MHLFCRMKEKMYFCSEKLRKMTQNSNSFYGFYYYFYFSK